MTERCYLGAGQGDESEKTHASASAQLRDLGPDLQALRLAANVHVSGADVISST
jgi:hypothetical protein